MSLQSAVNKTIGSIGAAHVAKTQKAEKAAREQEKLSKQAPSVKKLRYSQQVKKAALNRVKKEKEIKTILAPPTPTGARHYEKTFDFLSNK